MDHAPSKRVRPISGFKADTTPPNSSKRTQPGADTEEDPTEQVQLGRDSPTFFERLKQQCLPAKVQALPHVVKPLTSRD
ncbi:hypothetical protein PI125_g12854 [Phytophthora idaei]|nr:hypothetical protein PI125_g12854 [Phytophthora idaei]KAG3149627.1 hypothetical protein PI126_g11921 [Phytophthora idaei]